MKRVLRQLTVFLTLLIVVFVIWFPYDSYSKDVVRAVREDAARLGVFVDIASLSISFPGKCEFTNISGMVHTYDTPFSFTIDKGQGSFRWLSLLGLSKELEGSVEAYDGTIQFHTEQSLTGGPVQVELLGTNLKLSKHPVLDYHSLRGNVGFEFEASLSEKNGESFGYLVTKIREGRIEDWKKLEGSLAYSLGFPAGMIKLSTVTDITFDSLLSSKGRKLEIENLHLTSSVGNAAGNGTASLGPTGLLQDGRIDISLDLTPEGTAIFGPYLSLAAQKFSESPPSSWSIAILLGRGSRPHVSVTPRK